MAGVWVLVATTLLTLHQATAAPIVDAPWGRIQGLDSVSVSGLNYTSYLAIPFAKPPVGELRFAKPVAHPGYNDGRVFSATRVGDQCLQLANAFGTNAVAMSEDCLTLNVYVPVSPSSGPRNVMVWIHGGGFSIGSAASYTPSELVTENDVIVVVIQYRLDSLGFLSTGDDTVPGNFGLWDQNLAIRWVKTNIGAFGGDPESMTVFGESAGAASVGYQMVTPASTGLKFRAIMQSGTPLARWALNKNPDRAFNTLANNTGCLDGVVSSWTSSISYYFTSEAQKRAERERVLACLRRLDARELIRSLFPEGEIDISVMAAWLPVVDGDFLPRDPAQLMSDVSYLDSVGATARDVIIGINNDEGALMANVEATLNSSNSGYSKEEEQKLRDFYGNPTVQLRSLMTDQLLFRYGENLQKESQRLDTLVNVLEFYYTQWSGSGAGTVSKQNIADAWTDTYFLVNTVEFVGGLAKAKAVLSGSRSSLGRHYLYLFNHYPAYKAGLQNTGTYHGDEIGYEFDPIPELGNRAGFSSDEYAIASTFRTLLTSFAKTGQPQVPLLNSQTSGVNVWPEFTLTEENYLSLERVPRVADNLYGQRFALWTDLVPSVYNSTRAPKPTSPWIWQQQQQQQQMWNCRSPVWQQMANGMAKTFTFTGRLTFFKLP